MLKILAIGDFHGKFPKKLKNEAEKADIILCIGDFAGIEGWRPYLLYCYKFYAKGLKPEKSTIEFMGEKKYYSLIREDNLAGRKILTEINKIKKKIIYVFGNGDDGFYSYPFGKFFEAEKSNTSFIKKLKNMKNITYGRAVFKGISFIGFGGYMDIDAYLKDKKNERYKKILERRKKSEKNFYSRLKKFKKNDIFVFHYPPRGFFDVINAKDGNPMNGKSAGVGFFTDAIKKYKPLFVVCGHMHEYQGVKKLGKTQIIATGAASEGKAALILLDEKKKRVLNVKFLR